MTKLTQKKVMFVWGDKQEAVFQLLKQKLCSAPILALPEGSKDFIAYCDASIKDYLYGTKCTVFTDHKSLQHILNQKELNMRLDNQFIERDHLNGIGFVLDFVEFISFTFGDKEMISVIEAVSR
ncbi:putative reverse transcriptase domain-containing protein [Tanacetum coccineum]